MFFYRPVGNQDYGTPLCEKRDLTGVGRDRCEPALEAASIATFHFRGVPQPVDVKSFVFRRVR